MRGHADRAEATLDAVLTFRGDAALEHRRFLREASSRLSLLDAAGFYDIGDQFLEAMSDVNPKDWSMLNNRAYELADREVHIEKAVELAERAVALAPDANAGPSLDTLAWAYVKVQRTAEAISIFEKLLADDVKSAIHQYHYGVALAQASRTSEAVKAFDRALDSKDIAEAFREKIKEAKSEAETARSPGSP